ncbi:MAG: Cof-type HAD-IIB family hydrolase [Treponema sp.]|nr:Cof-type HAD-IIB family hydrolase [Treponema sp.]
MKPIRILAIDMDDTLLSSELSISPRTREAIKRTEQAGVIIVLASGRIPEAMDPYVRFLGLNTRPGYLISNNGALITESDTGNVVHESMLDHKTILTICDLAEQEGFPLQMYADNITYISRKNKYSDIDEKLTGLRQVVVENFRDLADFGCYKLIVPGEPELLSGVENLLRKNMQEKLGIFTSRKYFLQVSHGDSNKGAALSMIAGLKNISAEETMAIGDSMNDEAMIRWAGIGVAMANGDERLKKIADAVSEKTNDEDGVAEIIKKYILDK